MVFNRKQKRNLLKLLSFFSLIRGYNLIVLVLAQYLTARYILNPEQRWIRLLLDANLFFIVAASVASTASGYIINNFYDAQKDQINRPKKFLLEHLVSQRTQLVLYLILNCIAIFFASWVSLRALLFFLVYIFAIWIYSSWIKRLFWLSNLFSALLMIMPFWAITLYFKNFKIIIFYHALFLFLLIFSRDIIKDFENFKGDWVHRYQTLPTVFNQTITKMIISISILCCAVPIHYLLGEELGLMHYYFMFSGPFLIGFLVLLWVARSQKLYLWLHNLIKFWIFIGVISIALLYNNPF